MPYIIICLVSAFFSANLSALPIAFGYNQSKFKFNEQETKNFRVFHDERTPNEARMILESLEKAKPVLERWMNIKRDKLLPVISSAESDEASFANFITDAIEIQSLGQGDKSLFWHEFTHMTMYLHLKNILGIPGVILHIPWMPAWFIEGLAEALSVSIGSTRQSSLERFQAMHNDWPSYDSLHSLYKDNFIRGYGTSGAFVAWILRKGTARDPQFLPKLLKFFYKYTLPQYYIYSVNPFSKFLPMDNSFKELLGMTGRELWGAYKREAFAHWQSKKTNSLFAYDESFKRRRLFSSVNSLSLVDKVAYMTIRDSHTKTSAMYPLIFNDKSGWIEGWASAKILLGRDPDFSISSFSGDFILGVKNYKTVKTGRIRNKIVNFNLNSLQELKVVETIHDKGTLITWLGESKNKVIWSENVAESSKLCFKLKDSLFSSKAINCPIKLDLPMGLKVIGASHKKYKDKLYVDKLWYSIKTHRLVSDGYSVWEWDLNKDKPRILIKESLIEPNSISLIDKELAVLWGGRNRYFIQKLSQKGKCLSEFVFDDYISKAYHLSEYRFVFGLREGKDTSLRVKNLNDFKSSPCRSLNVLQKNSPLIVALAKDNELSLAEALEQASLWRDEKSVLKTVKEPGLGKSLEKIVQAKPAKWRPHRIPVILFPLIGANDIKGEQLGIVTIPLMDQMQNETLYLQFLLGIQSKYPDTLLTLQSERFWPSLSLTASRQQRWAGRFLDLNDLKVKSSYIDQKSLSFAASFPFHLSNSLVLNASPSFLYADRKNYFGPDLPLKGRLALPSLTVSSSYNYGPWSLAAALGGSVAPSLINKTFDYNKFGLSFGAAYDVGVLDSSVALNLNYNLTRGKKGKTPLLKEVYFPLRSFVPGSGGSVYVSKFPITNNSSLFVPQFGDTSGRLVGSFSLPIVKNFDKLLWILYLEELRYTANLSYGGAWNQDLLPKKDFLILSHNHNFDFGFETKGVGFSLGGGFGQVYKESIEFFVSLGFNAVF